MNQIAEQKLGHGVAVTNAGGGFEVTPSTLSDVVEFARFMCQSKAGIPSFLRENAPDCAAVVMQSLKWGFDPFSVAQKSYKVKDVIAYEAQLIAAVVNTRSGIKGRLKYTYEGEGESLQCTVTGILGGEECSYTSPRFDQITTKNSPLWTTDPQQQLGYYSARSWARRHTPEVILGVYDREEAASFQGPDNAKDVTPSIVGRLKAAQETTEQHADAPEGFSEGFAHSETEALAGEAAAPDQNTDGEAPDLPVSDAAPAGEVPPQTHASPAPFLVRFAHDAFSKAIDQEMTGTAFSAVMKRWHPQIEKLDEGDQEKAKQIGASAKRLFSDSALYDGIIEFYSEMLGVEPSELIDQ